MEPIPKWNSPPKWRGKEVHPASKPEPAHKWREDRKGERKDGGKS